MYLKVHLMHWVECVIFVCLRSRVDYTIYSECELFVIHIFFTSKDHYSRFVPYISTNTISQYIRFAHTTFDLPLGIFHLRSAMKKRSFQFVSIFRWLGFTAFKIYIYCFADICFPLVDYVIVQYENVEYYIGIVRWYDLN